MKIYTYWAKQIGNAVGPGGRPFRITSWGGSNDSVADAQVAALERLKASTQKIIGGHTPDEYYSVSIREELVNQLHNDNGELIAAITRNRYGALVLNTTSVLFADVDVPYSNRYRPNWFAGLFKNAAKKAAERTAHDENTHQKFMTRFQAFSAANPDLKFRIYKTSAGYRLVVMNRRYSPTDGKTYELLKDLGSDPLYIRLCRTQECFRARLQPKPWRCGTTRPPHTFPQENSEQRRNHQHWLKGYELASQNYTVCRKVAELGNGTFDTEVLQVLAMHDKHVLGLASKPLA